MIVSIIISGIAGTALMTAFVYLISRITSKQLKVIHVLGTMLTGQTTASKNISTHSSAYIIGLTAHYLVGILFAFVYHWLWSTGVGNPDILYGLLFGFINGIVAVAGWRLFIAIHPNPPHIDLPGFLVTIFSGHLFFGIGIVIAYRILNTL